jgi:hypothetical protein
MIPIAVKTTIGLLRTRSFARVVLQKAMAANLHIDEKTFVLKVCGSQLAPPLVTHRHHQQHQHQLTSSSVTLNDKETLADEERELELMFASIGAGIVAVMIIVAVMVISERLARAGYSADTEPEPAGGFAESDEEEDMDNYEEWLA